MKFLQLRHAIEIAFGQVPHPEPKLEPRTIPLYDPDQHRRRRELVAGGEILWKPVNKMAAMVIAKAPWWAKPPVTNEINHPVLEHQHKPKRPRLSHKPKRKPAACAERCVPEEASETPTPPPDRQSKPQAKSELTREEVAAMLGIRNV